MRTIILLLLLASLASCKQRQIADYPEFAEAVVNLAIAQKNNQTLELRDLYDSLAAVIPDEDDERSILVQILKGKGFSVTGWGRGNFFHGPRVVTYNLKNEACECLISKYYYTTMDRAAYLRTEAISCR